MIFSAPSATVQGREVDDDRAAIPSFEPLQHGDRGHLFVHGEQPAEKPRIGAEHADMRGPLGDEGARVLIDELRELLIARALST